MKFLEKDLEEIIFTTQKEKLGDRGLYIEGKLIRQLRIGNYGVADLVEVNRCVNPNWDGTKLIPELSITVYELKKDKIGISAFLQALGYLKGIKKYLECRGFNHKVSFSIVLIGKEIDTASTYCYLSEFIWSEFSLYNYVYTYDVEGINFQPCEGYSLINDGFNLRTSKPF